MAGKVDARLADLGIEIGLRRLYHYCQHSFLPRNIV